MIDLKLLEKKFEDSLTDENVEDFVREIRMKEIEAFYKEWCKEKKINGNVLLGSPIKDCLLAFSKFKDKIQYE